MNVTERDDSVVAVSRWRQSVAVHLGKDWSSVSGDQIVRRGDYRADKTMRVDPTAPIRLPSTGTRVVQHDGERRVPVGTTERLDNDTTLAVDAAVLTLLRLPAGGTVSVTSDDVTVTTDGEVVLGFGSPPATAPGRIRVESWDAPSLADAVTALSATLPDTDSPRRTWPNARPPQPPRLSISDGVHPSHVETVDTDVRIVLPGGDDALRSVIAVSSLAVYLAADVTVDPNATGARLSADGATFALGTSAEEIDETASTWLRRVFYLDCLARSAGPHGTRLVEPDALDVVSTDAGTLHDTPLSVRVRQYFSVDDTDVAALDERLPTWPYVVHTAPDRKRLGTLSKHAGQLADVRLPRASHLETVGETVRWGEERRIRGDEDEDTPEIPETLLVPEAVDDRRVVGWNAPGHPTGAFEVADAPIRALHDNDDLRVTVVGSDHDATDVIDCWTAREDTLPLDIQTLIDPTVETLRDALTEETDLVHIAAHHDRDGIECSDGSLGRGELSTLDIGARVIMAHACGTHGWGRKAVRAGAGAVVTTTGPIPEETAQQTARDWAGLIALGWSVERATNLVRRITDPTGYVVIGDGSLRLAGSDSGTPPLVAVDTDDWTAEVDMQSPHSIGWQVFGPIKPSEWPLPGAGPRDIDPEVLDDRSDRMESPILLGGSLTWPPFDAP